MNEEGLATTDEGQPERCQVCEFPKIVGHVGGEISGERYSLWLCPSCFEYTILTLREQYEQCRLFDDNFDFKELDAFGKLKKPGLREMLEQCDQSAAQPKEAAEFEQAKPVGREFGSDE